MRLLLSGPISTVTLSTWVKNFNSTPCVQAIQWCSYTSHGRSGLTWLRSHKTWVTWHWEVTWHRGVTCFRKPNQKVQAKQVGVCENRSILRFGLNAASMAVSVILKGILCSHTEVTITTSPMPASWKSPLKLCNGREFLPERFSLQE